jgi:hypothetical protein
LNILNGHLPPPGHCRIWYPDRPAGQQTPLQHCPVNSVRLGAWVVSRTEGGSKSIVVQVYPQQKLGVITDTRYYTAQ